MVRWEYLTVLLPTLDSLGDYGKEGWELVSVQDQETGGIRCVFKRKK